MDRDNKTSGALDDEDEDRTIDLPPEKLPAAYRRTVPDDFPPQEFDRYSFVRELGRGSMGQVYVYRETGSIDREVAIKFQRDSDRDTASRFHEEARIAARLQHPNVVTVITDGQYQGIPYIVFEYLDGQSLDKQKTAMPWAEVRKLGLQLASGLAAVHSADLIHRDIKPANAMLLDRGGQRLVKLIDFGVAKSSEAANRFGGSTGTPRYMAPEVWDNGRPTKRSDVYSLGLTLYQLCTGAKPPVHPYEQDVRLERPDIDIAFAGVVNRCLERDPAKRYASGAELYNALLPLYSVGELMDIDVQQWLRNDRADGYLWSGRKLERAAGLDLESLPPDHREFLRLARQRAKSAAWRKRALAGVMVLSVAAVYMGVRYVNQAALDAKVDRHVEAANLHLHQALDEHQLFDERRGAVLERFAAEGDSKEASNAWQQAISLEPEVDKKYRAAGQELEVALALDPSRGDVRGMLADVLAARARLASDTYRVRELSEHLERLSVYDTQAYESWTQASPVTLSTVPEGATVSLVRHDFQTNGAIVPEVVAEEQVTPFTTALAPGSYLFIIHARDEYIEFRYPHLMRHRAEPTTIQLTRPKNSQIPKGFVYIPGGKFLYGYGGRSEDEQIRSWYETVPLHERAIGPYVIARHETTYREWIEFLRHACQQPGCADQPNLVPNSKYDIVQLALLFTDRKRWQFSYQLGEAPPYTALEGEMWHHRGRSDAFARQDWLDFPVSGVKPASVMEYITWLRNSGRVANARLCTEYEWERAARGADTRTFPHSDALDANEANIDISHGDGGIGPDAVGAHPESVSPFGVQDMAGNVWEPARSPFDPAATTIRGGSFYQGYPTAKVVNRWRSVGDASPLVGLRICASVSDTEPNPIRTGATHDSDTMSSGE